MKKHGTCFLFLLILIPVFVSSPLAAQKYRKQVVGTFGVGYSVTGILFNLLQESLEANDMNSTKTPVLLGGLDYGITDRFSIGGVYTYQGLYARYSNYNSINEHGDTTIVTGDFHERLTRQSIGIRPLFHFGDNDDVDAYAGCRVSYVFWNYSGPRNDLNVNKVFRGLGPVKAQALFGVRYFITNNIGLGAEFALGPTYYVSFGLNLKFGGV